MTEVKEVIPHLASYKAGKTLEKELRKGKSMGDALFAVCVEANADQMRLAALSAKQSEKQN